MWLIGQERNGVYLVRYNTITQVNLVLPTTNSPAHFCGEEIHQAALLTDWETPQAVLLTGGETHQAVLLTGGKTHQAMLLTDGETHQAVLLAGGEMHQPVLLAGGETHLPCRSTCRAQGLYYWSRML